MTSVQNRAGAAPHRVVGQLQRRLKDAHACARVYRHYVAAAYKAKSGLGYTAYQYIGGLNLHDCERSLPTSLSRIKIIAHIISCMDHQKVVGQMPYLPHRLHQPCKNKTQTHTTGKCALYMVTHVHKSLCKLEKDTIKC